MGNSKSKKTIGEEFEEKSERKKLEFEEEMFDRLSTYFEDIEAKILPIKMSKEERQEMCDAAEEFLDNLLKDTAAIDERFKSNRGGLIRVGSFFEETDIICADRIQFFIVLDDISDNNIELITPANTRLVSPSDTAEDNIQGVGDGLSDLVNVYIKESHERRWEEGLDVEQGRFRLKSEKGVFRLFYIAIEKATESIRKKYRDKIFRKHGRLELNDGHPFSIQESTVWLKFTWNEELPVSVGITPVLKCNKEDAHMCKGDPITKILYDTVQSAGLYLLVPARGSDENFRWAFEHIEVQIMKKVLLASHKRAYRILRFLLHGFAQGSSGETNIFDDRALKMLLARHDHHCERKDHVADCVMTLLHEMREILDKPAGGSLFLPSIFNVQQNILTNKLASPRDEVLELNKKGLEKVTDHLLVDIRQTAKYDFDAIIKSFVSMNEYILKGDYHARKLASAKGVRHQFVEH